MNEVQIDKDYLDEAFVIKLNSFDESTIESLIKLMLEHYDIELTYDKIEYLNQAVKSMYSSEANPEHFIRQLKYLINKGIYNRLLKKYKSDLAVLGIKLEIIDLITDLQKKYYEENQRKNEVKSKEETPTVKDFSIKTEMPVYYSNYPLEIEGKNNEDIKKQNVILNFKLMEDNKDNDYMLKIEKDKLIQFFEQIEKIQEKIDKLS